MIASDSFVSSFVFEHSTNGILVSDSSGHIEAANPAAAALLNLPSQTLIGSSAERAFADLPALSGLFAGQTSAVVSLPNGRYAAGSAATLADGRRVVLLEDVTAQQSLEQRREDLLLRIAHDLRNPVASLIGYVDLIDTLGSLSDEQRHFVDRARETGVKFYAIIADLVDLAWIEADMPRQYLPIALDDCIANAVASLAQMALDKRITITTEVEMALPPVNGDSERLRALIDKLLRNAISYSLEGQTVTVRAWSSANSVFCSVSDQGIGIAEGERELVFDRLFRSPDPRVQSVPGGGLGLTTARSIALHHGGTLWLENVLGGGSTFTFRLPAAPE